MESLFLAPTRALPALLSSWKSPASVGPAARLPVQQIALRAFTSHIVKNTWIDLICRRIKTLDPKGAFSPASIDASIIKSSINVSCTCQFAIQLFKSFNHHNHHSIIRVSHISIEMLELGSLGLLFPVPILLEWLLHSAPSAAIQLVNNNVNSRDSVLVGRRLIAGTRVLAT